MRSFFVNILAVLCILAGLLAFLVLFAPAPLSEWGGIDRFRNFSTSAMFIGVLLIFLGLMLFRKKEQADVVSQKTTRKRKFQFIIIYWVIAGLLISYNFVHFDNLYHRDILIRQQMNDDYCKHPVKGYECFNSQANGEAGERSWPGTTPGR